MTEFLKKQATQKERVERNKYIAKGLVSFAAAIAYGMYSRLDTSVPSFDNFVCMGLGMYAIYCLLIPNLFMLPVYMKEQGGENK